MQVPVEFFQKINVGVYISKSEDGSKRSITEMTLGFHHCQWRWSFLNPCIQEVFHVTHA
jgi:hypothetical protein